MNYELFSGLPEVNPLWLETVTGLPQAIEKMKERAQQIPGAYFVYSCDQGMVVASIQKPSSQRIENEAVIKNGRARFESL